MPCKQNSKDNNSVRKAPLKRIADLIKANKWVGMIPKTQKHAKKKRWFEKQLSSFKEEPFLMPNDKRVTLTKDVLRNFYTIPEDTLWTGKSKGKDECYWEARGRVLLYRIVQVNWP